MTIINKECALIIAEEIIAIISDQKARDIRNKENSEVVKAREVYLEKQEDVSKSIHIEVSLQRNENSLQSIFIAPTKMETLVQHNISIYSRALQYAGPLSQPITKINIEDSLLNFIIRLYKSNSLPKTPQPVLPSIKGKQRAQHIRVKKLSLKPRQIKRDFNHIGS